MKIFLKILLFAVLGALGFFLFKEGRAAHGQEEIDPSKLVMLFAGVILLGGAVAVFVATIVMPWFGDALGNVFFSPNQAPEKDVHADARAALARGDYPAAIDAFQTVFDNDPSDTFALSEIAKIHCDHLDNPTAAAEFLEGMLQREWPPDTAAFISSRLVDVYWKHQHDLASARALLMQIVELMPGTKFAANAQHRLREIEQDASAEE